MAKKNILLIYLTVWSVLIACGGILFINYESTVDGYNDKFHLWIAVGVHAILLRGIQWAINKPHALNYPNEITEANKEKMYDTMLLFLSYLAIVTSVMFSVMIYTTLHDKATTVAYILLAIIVPTVVIAMLCSKVKKIETHLNGTKNVLHHRTLSFALSKKGVFPLKKRVFSPYFFSLHLLTFPHSTRTYF